MPTYRTAGAWGAGKGSNLTPAEVDGNFYELRTDLDDVIANPPTANSIASIAASGFTWIVTLTDSTVLDPLPIPVVYTVWRGDWAPLTLYSAADQFRVVDQGIFAVLQDHTSAATFDPAAVAGSPATPLYTQLIGVTSLPADTSIDELNDVTITSVAGNDFLVWNDGVSQWTNQTPAVVLGLLAPTLDDLTDVIATAPIAGQVLRYLGGSPDAGWQPDTLTLDDIGDVSVAAPGDGDVLTYQAGSPTGWVAAAPAAVPSTLDSLTDVAVPTPADGDFLQYDTGSPAGWKNQAGTTISSLGAATLPVNTASLLEISEASGSPVAYASKQIAIADILTGGANLPGSGQISAAGELGLGTAPGAQFHLGGSYTSANEMLLRMDGTHASSVTTAQNALSVTPIFSPTGASLSTIYGMLFAPKYTGALNLGNYVGFSSRLETLAGHTGVITIGAAFHAWTPTIGGTNPISTYFSFLADAITNGNGLTSGTVNNRAISISGVTASAAGGTLNNRGISIVMPSGGATSGTANNDGILISGNGGTAAGGTVVNYAIRSLSTSMSLLTGGLTVGTTTLLTSSVALANGAAAAAGTLANAPAAGNPTKWIPINDNGTTRYIPAW